MLSGKKFRRLQETASVASTLKIVTNGHAAKRRHRAGDVDSDDARRLIANPKEKWIVIAQMLIGMVRIVSRPDAAKFEENTPAYRVICRPVAICRESTKLWRLLGHVPGGDIFPSARVDNAVPSVRCWRRLGKFTPAIARSS